MEPQPYNCWKKIGVAGDRSCTELSKYTHCRNCPVYSTAGRSLLEREAPPEYLQEWTNLLAQQQVGNTASRSQQDSLWYSDSSTPLTTNSARYKQKDALSVLIFRLSREWLALSTEIIKEIIQPRVIHSLPHQVGARGPAPLLLGVVNIHGEIRMCVSLAQFLGLSETSKVMRQMSPIVYERMIVVEPQFDFAHSKDSSQVWVFPVDEVFGVHRFSKAALGEVPAVVAQATDTYTKALIIDSDDQYFDFANQKVNYLDERLLLTSLNSSLL